MRHAWTALCWAVIALGVVMACTKKPAPPVLEEPQPILEESSETREADGRALDGFEDFPHVLYFDLNSTTPKRLDHLAELAQYLKRTGKAVRLEGHTCPIGAIEYNEALGYHRAAAVRDYLTASGVSGGKIEVLSYGEERPVAFTFEEFHRNRRVEVRLQ